MKKNCSLQLLEPKGSSSAFQTSRRRAFISLPNLLAVAEKGVTKAGFREKIRVGGVGCCYSRPDETCWANIDAELEPRKTLCTLVAEFAAAGNTSRFCTSFSGGETP